MSNTYTKNYIATATKAEGINMIRHNLRTNDKWLLRGLLAIYKHQTTDEQQEHNTYYRNNIGFGATDAVLLTSFAQQYQQRSHLSIKQIDITREKMIKYAGQLYNIAQANLTVETK